MKPFEVYPLLPITPVKARGCNIWDDMGNAYLDLYGGHAVISIGHSHPAYVKAIQNQVEKLGFYSNSVQIPIQQDYARKLGKLSGFPEYNLFLVNSGAEAIENALKLASFETGKTKIIAFDKSFHGRTSLAVSITDNPGIQAAINRTHETEFIPLNDSEALAALLAKEDVAAVVIEGIQGIAGIYESTVEFLQTAKKLCQQHGALLILDEIQSGFGRTGKFFAHQHAGIRPDLITVAKGMGNGFPIGGILINPGIKARFGRLGTTFGGSHLACAAALSVLDVIEKEDLMDNASKVGNYLIQKLKTFDVVEVRGHGLMIGIEFNFKINPLRADLLNEFRIFTGVASSPYTLRILPPLCLSMTQANEFLEAVSQLLMNKEKYAAVSLD